MPTAVIDASALAAILFAEPRAGSVTEQIDGTDLTAPTLIRHEIISVALKKRLARGRGSRVWDDGLRRYAAFRIREVTVPPAAVFALALETGLSGYDASYLWLARRFHLPLVTLDGDLERAAQLIR